MHPCIGTTARSGQERFCGPPNSSVFTCKLQILGKTSKLVVSGNTPEASPSLPFPPAGHCVRGSMAGSVWKHFYSPPNSPMSTCRSQILGKGRYGWVLLGRYRGTSVCVKRLLPRSTCKLASIFDTDGPIDATPVTMVPDAVAASMQSGSRVAPRRKSSMRPTDSNPHGELVGRVKSVLAPPPLLLSPAASLALPDADNNFVLLAEPSSRDARRWQHLTFFRSGWPPSRDLQAPMLARAAGLAAGILHKRWGAGYWWPSARSPALLGVGSHARPYPATQS